MPLIINKDLWLSGCFKIQILTTDGDPFDVTAAKPVFKINGFEHLSSYFDTCPMHQEADPFLFVHDDRLFLFYESKRFYERGELKMTSTADLKSWSEPVTVLKEPFHLSYPWVFEDNGEIYMIPETQEDKSIRLYKADDRHLTSFTFVKKLVVDDESQGIIHSFCDSSFTVKDGKHYMFTSQLRADGGQEQPVYVQRLFVSDSLEGDYVEHPCSPICVSNKYGRDGGSIISYDGKLLRVAQECEANNYGGDINMFEITELSPSDYEEVLSKKNLLYRKTAFYMHGGHQYNFVKFHGTTVLATDAKGTKLFLFAKLMHQLRKLV